MQAVWKKAAFAKERGLFRAATAADVTWHLCKLTCLSLDPSYHHSIYDSLTKVSKVDVFVSHSWSCPVWRKGLAVCHYLNLDSALASSFLASIVAVSVLVLHAGSFSAVALLPPGALLDWLLFWPLSVFFLMYLFGHVLAGKSFWFDHICVDQADLEIKSQTLQAIPAFVAHSTEMLALWDETYCQRLWCNYELAVHAKTAERAEAITIVPTWMPLWTLCWFAMTASLCVFNVQAAVLDKESRVSLLVSMIRKYVVPPYAFLFASVPLSWFSLEKLKRHKSMLDEMALFDFGNAKCTLETDRHEIEEQVLCLFDEALAPPIRVAFDGLEGSGIPKLEHMDGADGVEGADVALLAEAIHEIRHVTSYPSRGEVIQCFNAYVRGPLRAQSHGQRESDSNEVVHGFEFSFLVYRTGKCIWVRRPD
ncbi:unnamed protein product [Effrenium voratum]|nr:unnamed protein product [Effrenium voratum]